MRQIFVGILFFCTFLISWSETLLSHLVLFEAGNSVIDNVICWQLWNQFIQKPSPSSLCLLIL